MKKELIYVFVVLVISLFVLSGCEGIKGKEIVPKESKVSPLIYRNYIEVKGKEEVSNMYMDKKEGIFYYKTIPLFSLNLKGSSNEMNLVNAQRLDELQSEAFLNPNQEDRLQFSRWRSANTNHGITGHTDIRNENNELISVRFSQGRIFEDVPLIRENDVVYPNGRYFTFEFSEVTEDMLEEMPAAERASTLRFRTYYVNDLTPVLGLNDREGDERVMGYFTEKLEEWGNDMDHSILTTTLFKGVFDSDHPDEEEFVKWFVTYIQYFDEDGRPITELPKAISLLTVSEKALRFSERAYGYFGLTGSRMEGNNLVLNYDGFEWGDFVEDENGFDFYENWFRPNLPIFEGLEIRQGLEEEEVFV